MFNEAGWHGGWFGFGVGHMMLFWILFAVVVVGIFMWSIRAQRSDTRAQPDKLPVDILKERYARGELEHEEFEQKKRDLDA